MNLATIRRQLEALERKPAPEPPEPMSDWCISAKLTAVCAAGSRPEASYKQRTIAQRLVAIAAGIRDRVELAL